MTQNIVPNNQESVGVSRHGVSLGCDGGRCGDPEGRGGGFPLNLFIGGIVPPPPFPKKNEKVGNKKWIANTD